MFAILFFNHANLIIVAQWMVLSSYLVSYLWCFTLCSDQQGGGVDPSEKLKKLKSLSFDGDMKGKEQEGVMHQQNGIMQNGLSDDSGYQYVPQLAIWIIFSYVYISTLNCPIYIITLSYMHIYCLYCTHIYHLLIHTHLLPFNTHTFTFCLLYTHIYSVL